MTEFHLSWQHYNKIWEQIDDLFKFQLTNNLHLDFVHNQLPQSWNSDYYCT